MIPTLPYTHYCGGSVDISENKAVKLLITTPVSLGLIGFASRSYSQNFE